MFSRAVVCKGGVCYQIPTPSPVALWDVIFCVITEKVTSFLALFWGEGQIYASTKGDVASLDMSGSWVGIFITPPAILHHVSVFSVALGICSEEGDPPHLLQCGRWREKAFIYYERAGNIPKRSPLPAAAVGKGKHLKIMGFVDCH